RRGGARARRRRARPRRRAPGGRRHPIGPARRADEGATLMVDLDRVGFGTRAVHGAGPADPQTGAVVPPISLATTFAQDGVGELRGGFEYSRSANPTRTAVERHLAVLEGAAHGFLFASGLAAEDALLRLCRPGAHAVLPDGAYGGTIRLARRVHEPAGVEIDVADLTDLDALRA